MKIKRRHVFIALAMVAGLLVLSVGIYHSKPYKEWERVVLTDRFKVLWLAISDYVRDHPYRLPPMENAQTLAQHLSAYSYARGFLKYPGTGEFYQPNPHLSDKSLDDFKFQDPSTLILLYEPRPARNGERAVMFLDGHIEHLTEAEWQRVQPALEPAR